MSKRYPTDADVLHFLLSFKCHKKEDLKDVCMAKKNLDKMLPSRIAHHFVELLFDGANIFLDNRPLDL